MNDDKLRWLEINAGGHKAPAWVRRAALAADGTVFIPGGAVSSEMDVLLCASYDGISFKHHGGHAYFPADWLRQEFPKAAALVTKIEQSVREFFA